MGLGCVLTGLAYLVFRLIGLPTTVPERAVATLLFAAFYLTAVIAGIAVFQGGSTAPGRPGGRSAANSFGIYYVHPLVLYRWRTFSLTSPRPRSLRRRSSSR